MVKSLFIDHFSLCIVGDLKWVVLKGWGAQDVINKESLLHGNFQRLELSRYVYHAHDLIMQTMDSNELQGGELNYKSIGERFLRLSELLINCLH